MELKIAGIVPESITDGRGLRYVLFLQGCPHKCEGCHNAQTWDFDKGEIMDTAQIIEQILSNPLIDGITFSGGEPMCQPKPLLQIVNAVKNKNTVIYSGYTFEELQQKADPDQMALLRACDILIDGRFILQERDLTLRFRGSKNQRIIDLKQSFLQQKTILAENY